MLTLSMDSRPHITANLGYKTQLYFIPVFWSNRDRYVMYYALQLHTKYSISPSDFGSKALVPACPPAFRSQGSLGWKISNQGGLALILNKCFQQFVSISIKIFASFSIITFFCWTCVALLSEHLITPSLFLLKKTAWLFSQRPEGYDPISKYESYISLP